MDEEYCDDDREYIRVRKTEVAGTGLPKDTMEDVTPISRDQLQQYMAMSYHADIRRATALVLRAANAKKTNVLLPNTIGEIQIGYHIPIPSDYILALQRKFPGCKITYLQEEWYEENPTTRKKVTGILIDWS